MTKPKADPVDIAVDPNWKSPHEVEMQRVRFGLAKNLCLYRDCAVAGCRRNRTCMRPEKTPCYWKHFRALKASGIFDLMRESVNRQLKGPPVRARPSPR